MSRRQAHVVRQWNRPTRSLGVEVQGRVTCLTVCERAVPVVTLALNRQGLADLLTLLAQANGVVVATENLLALVDLGTDMMGAAEEDR